MAFLASSEASGAAYPNVSRIRSFITDLWSIGAMLYEFRVPGHAWKDPQSPEVHNLLGYFIALIAGTVVGAIAVIALKSMGRKPAPEPAEAELVTV